MRDNGMKVYAIAPDFAFLFYSAVLKGQLKMDDSVEVDDSKRIKGKILNLKLARGFGFISCDDGRDYFFHHSEVMRGSVAFRNLKENDLVSFIPQENPNQNQGPKALAVIRIKEVSIN